jgi:CheY-like chemotaxis protein
MLVIDDSTDTCELYQQAFELQGHSVAVAHDATSGIQAANAGEHDAALIDIGLPGTDGYVLAQQLRASDAGRRLVLVAVTGHASAEDRARALAAGFDLHLAKPIDIFAVIGELTRIIEDRETAV